MSNAKYLKDLRFLHFPLQIDYDDANYNGKNGQNYSFKESIYTYEEMFQRAIIIVNKNKRLISFPKSVTLM